MTSSEEGGLRRRLAALLTVLVMALVGVWGVVRVVLPPAEPPALPARAAEHAPLTQRLLLVVVDGLRYDVALDAELMPAFSQAMRSRQSAELWAGRVSMTTSAILSLGTGQPGGFEQVVRNVRPPPTPYDSWLRQAKAAGRRVIAVGDPAWGQMYRGAFALELPDPEGVSIEVDYNPQTFADTRRALALKPDAVIAHFVSPDHQGHAYGIYSEKYRTHIRGYDALLAELLAELSPEWTVVVLGDHGAADSGTHGSDVPVQRRTVLYAYGPGIARGTSLGPRVDQVDLAGTLAVLLGLPLPAHGRGHVLVDWLDLDPALRARVACSDLARAVDYARRDGRTAEADAAAVELGACAQATPAAAIAAAHAGVARLDAQLASSTGTASPWALPTLALVWLLGLLAAWLLVGRHVWPAVVPVLAVLWISVGLTWGVERLAGPVALGIRIALFASLSAPLLVLLFFPAHVGRWLRRLGPLLPALVPGVLVATYTTNAPPVAIAAAAVVLLVLLLVGGVEAREGWLLSRARWRASRWEILWLALAAAVFSRLAVPGWGQLPRWLVEQPLPLGLAAGASLGLGAWLLTARSSLPAPRLLAAVALVALAFGLRRVLPAWLGQGALVLSLAGMLLALVRRRAALALLAGLCAYSLLSRDGELPLVMASLVLADRAGAALTPRASDAQELGAASLALAVLLLFALVFLQRIGVQGSLDLGSMDWGAGGFGDPSVAPVTIGVSLGLKYALAAWLLVGCFLRHLEAPFAGRVLGALTVAFVARGALLLAMLLLAGTSFWTALRVLSELPLALLYALALALAGVGWAALPRPAHA